MFERIASRQPLARSVLQRATHLGKRRPAGQGLGERRDLGLAGAEPPHRFGQDLAIGAAAVCLKCRFDVVEPAELGVGTCFAEHAAEDTANPAVPVNQRPVAVEGRPALVHAVDESAVSRYA